MKDCLMFPFQNKTVIVNAAALRSSGAISIYRQFIYHLSKNTNRNRYYIFIDSSVEQPVIDGVIFVHDDNHSWRHRIAWEHGGLKRWLKQRNIIPDVIVSLQNTGSVIECQQVVYYHQPLPFYPRKWNLLKAKERMMWLYKHIYPFFVSSTLNDKTDVVVQIPFIKRGFCKKYKFAEDRVHVLFPDVEKIETDKIIAANLSADCLHFIYPATPFPYKEHKTLVEAVRILRQSNPSVFAKIRIHFTIPIGGYPLLEQLIVEYGVSEQFVFDGVMSHENLLSFYKASRGLLFPSTIETLGLPLLEAAAFGLPIMASDLDYAHEVLNGYEGVMFAKAENHEKWADLITRICEEAPAFEPLTPKESSWGKFFELINK
ncbi:glycosyltransferase [uncultured Bacteroides sp.]|uniref:glycosyltransferase n=1 Tax=uncultured Bacteroides sp. TaxID=162156 RepID=UPI0025957EFD|nr:glycosyltransferase [uncultured Bacteroides sp.]